MLLRSVTPSSPNVMILFNGIPVAIRREYDGLGLFSVVDMTAGTDLGDYSGMRCAPDVYGDYVVHGKYGTYDGDPCINTVWVDGVPIGNGGKAVLAYINEASPPHKTNVCFVMRRDGTIGVIAIADIPAGAPLHICYGAQRDWRRGYRHGCSGARCIDAKRKMDSIVRASPDAYLRVRPAKSRTKTFRLRP
jgi:hypothetical protein